MATMQGTTTTANIMSSTNNNSMPAGSAGPSSVGIGNYKGVMLCNRPFGGLVAAVAKASHDSQGGGSRPFKCGCTANETGYQYTREPKITNRIKKETALTRHKRWLQELQREKGEAESKYLSEQATVEERRSRFAAKEAKMRALIRKTNRLRRQRREQNDEGDDSEETRRNNEYDSEDDDDKYPEVDEEQEGGSGKKKNNKAALSSKPKWSMTEEEAMEVAEREDDAEVGRLINFARGLDFERYIDDLEVRTMMEQVLHRIQSLESGKARDEADEQARATWKGTGSFKTGSFKHTNNNQEDYDDEKGAADGRGVFSLAKGALATSEDGMGTIHSARSVAAIVMRSMDKSSNNKSRLSQVAEEEGEEEKEGCRGGRTLAEPKIVKIDEENGTRIHGRKTLSQLPYLNRNPAI